jgi:hypothetical protein
MNLPVESPPIANPPQAAWRFLLETLADGRVTAWVAELPDCRVTAASRAAAIADLEKMTADRTASIESVTFQPELNPSNLPEHPALKFIGVFEGDPDFADILADMRAERELTDDNPAYT